MSKKKNDDPKSEKALFLQRFVAFLIDVFIVSTLASMLASPFVNTKKIEDLEEKSYKLVSDFSEKKDNTKWVYCWIYEYYIFTC